MASSADDWSSNANDAVHISLVEPANGSATTIETFHPNFTYPIFGDEESIFGYKGLKIHLRYNKSDMRPNLLITYDERFKAQGEVEPTDIKGILSDFLPRLSFDKTSMFDAAINDPSLKTFTPPGQVLKTEETADGTYEIRYGNSSDIAIQQLLLRLQALVSFFIEGGSPIDLAEWESGRWTVFLQYKKSPASDPSVSPYTFMGYCTAYQYYPLIPKLPLPAPGAPRKAISRPTNHDVAFPFPDDDLSDLPIRSRISQFIILPPFQHGGNGARLYNTIFAYFLRDPHTVEITIEDPNEAFDDLRDVNDLAFLRTLPAFQALHINTDVQVRRKGRIPMNDIISQSALDALRKETKIAPRQFQRVVEMQLLSKIPSNIRKSFEVERPSDNTPETKAREHEYRLWCLMTKQRLYKHNKDTLVQLDRTERIERLDEAVESVELDYVRLLRKLEERGGSAAKESGAKENETPQEVGAKENETPKENGTAKMLAADGEAVLTPGKRTAEDVGVEDRASKKARTEDA